MATLHAACCVELGSPLEHFVALLAYSLDRNTPASTDVTLHVIYNPLDGAGLERLHLPPLRHVKIKAHPLDTPRAAPFEAKPGNATWWRLLLPELLRDVDRVVYIDSDMLVLGDLTPLATLDLGGNLAAATIDWYGAVKTLKGANIGQARRPVSDYFEGVHALTDQNRANYFNAGFMVLDLKAMRETGADRQLIDLATTKHRELPYLDQSVLNLVLAGRIKYLPFAYNMFASRRWRGGRLKFKYRGDFIRGARHPVILHFAGTKPWDRPWRGRARRFWAYAEASGQRGYFEGLAEASLLRRVSAPWRPLYGAAMRYHIRRGVRLARKIRAPDAVPHTT
jgi:lipopolysaccharide biosynthesis glycosyltransferase